MIQQSVTANAATPRSQLRYRIANSHDRWLAALGARHGRAPLEVALPILAADRTHYSCEDGESDGMSAE
jgi:hypothetical protein